MPSLRAFDEAMRRRRGLLAAGTLPLLLLITALDGERVAEVSPHGQAAANVLTLLYWFVLSRAASSRLRVLMLVGLVAATAGEVLFSLGLGMYEYRLEQIPVYVPPGHTLLYAAVFVSVRLGWFRRHAAVLTPLLLSVGALYSVLRWHLLDDVFGLACFGVFCALVMVVRTSRLFFAAMYLLVAYLELAGTAFGAWSWPPVLFGKLSAVPSANPPSGVAVFYCVFDLCCLALYFGVRLRSFDRFVSALVRRRGRPAEALRS